MSQQADAPQTTPAQTVQATLGFAREFFFSPCHAHTLSVIRIATGLMIAYIHFIWMMGVHDFFGPNSILNGEVWQQVHAGKTPDWKWSYLVDNESLTLARLHLGAAFVAGILAAAGFMTRASMIAAWLLTLMTVHRMTGFLFGLDQIIIMLSMYLCLSQSGRVASLDAVLAKLAPQVAFSKTYRVLSGWHGTSPSTDLMSWRNRLSTRMIQLHLCVVYLFGGLGKLRGEMWWDGSAMWYSAASYDYQSIDLTWIGLFPVLGAILTHLTLFWEVSYSAIVWPRWLRPWTLLTALLVHGGIAIHLGMVTFGAMMIVANCAFVPPAITRRIFLTGRRWLTPKSSSIELRNAPSHR